MKLTSRELETQLENVRALESRLTFRLSTLSKLIDQGGMRMLEGSPLSLTAYRVLNVVDTFDTMSVSDISRYCVIDRAQASRMATDLETKGWVAFQNDPESKRKKIVVLTKAGRELLDSIRPRFIDRNARLDEQLGPERRAALIDAIDCLSEVVEP